MKTMNSLVKHNQHNVYHVSPLHYLVFIFRAQNLFSKVELNKLGFLSKHFRTTSSRTDVVRGFSDLVHCTNKSQPPILGSKLALGYPHIEYCFPSNILKESSFLLCRYNIAKNRGLFTESQSTGYCYDSFKIPVAKLQIEKERLLDEFSDSHIEILIKSSICLPGSTVIRTFREADYLLVKEYLSLFKLDWKVVISKPNVEYQALQSRDKEVLDYLNTSLKDATWRGTGLEYDR